VDSKRKADYKKRKLVEEVVEKVYLISRGQGFTTQVRKLVEEVVEKVSLISRGQGFTTQVRKLVEEVVEKVSLIRRGQSFTTQVKKCLRTMLWEKVESGISSLSRFCSGSEMTDTV
jgi:uncharacterized protein YcgL (UPF0745 family)